MITGGHIVMMLLLPALGGIFMAYTFELWDEYKENNGG
jgi:hypothetical protein